MSWEDFNLSILLCTNEKILNKDEVIAYIQQLSNS